MTNLFYCLNATIPVFLLMILGLVFMKLHIFDEAFVKKMNTFVFNIALPTLVFYDLGRENFFEVWDTRYVIFCFIATACSIGLVILISYALRDKSLQGEFIQVSYRSSAAILGAALMQNIYGNAGMIPLMIIGSIPLYNIMAVVILTFFQPDRKPLDKTLLQKAIVDIAKNPILIGIWLGLIWSLLQVEMPPIMDKTVESVARLATPLGLMAMGATFDLKKALASFRTAGLGTFIKLIGLGCIFLPIAISLGFRTEKLAAALIMCGSPTTVSSYIMAKNMGHEGTLTSSTIMLTTFFSAFTLTTWLFILKSFGYL
ncbi:MAG: AEC family transporter [Firmicutes bacterium]|nr:AEC family transporter [Bacillota bacterium]